MGNKFSKSYRFEDINYAVASKEDKEQLDSDTETLFTTARKHLCQFSTLTYQQMDGLNTVLPYGLRKIDAKPI